MGCCSAVTGKRPIPIGKLFLEGGTSVKVISFTISYLPQHYKRTGAIIDENNHDLEVAFHSAINRENMYNAHIEFVPSVIKVPVADSFVVEKKGMKCT